MDLMPLATYLEAAGVGKIGQSIFVDQMPSACERGVMLRNRRPGVRIDYNLPGYLKGQIQLMARSHDYQDGSQLIDQALKAITLISTQVGAQFFNYCRPDTTPTAFPTSAGNFIEWTTALNVCFVEG
ncbi:minor capsid protein [Burkholderia gladioli]|uniref:minor capsid protein n=1 Tax=Burkholderia gladioli TaxID=28095 RepID=UPI003B512989